MSKSDIKREKVKLALYERALKRLRNPKRVMERLNAPPKILNPERISQLKKLGKLPNG